MLAHLQIIQYKKHLNMKTLNASDQLKSLIVVSRDEKRHFFSRTDSRLQGAQNQVDDVIFTLLLSLSKIWQIRNAV